MCLIVKLNTFTLTIPDKIGIFRGMTIDHSSIKKILVIQFRPFGDVLLATSYFEALKNRYPDCTIDFLVSEPFDQIIRGHPLISEIITTPKKGGLSYFTGRLKAFWHCRKKRYDLIIDQQNGVSSRTVFLFVPARYRLGWKGGKASLFYNLAAPTDRPDRYAAARNFDMLLPLGIEERPFSLTYKVTDSAQSYVDRWLKEKNIPLKKFICVAPGAHDPRKRWDQTCFIELVNMIPEKTGCPVVLLGAKGELEDFKSEARKKGLKQKVHDDPTSSLDQAAAMLVRCGALICNDGAMNHLSTATETPAVCVFGPTDVTHWSPQGTIPLHYHVVNPRKNNMAGDSFGVTPDMVFRILEKLLSETGLPTSHP
jgi:heptosyltransferase III